MIRYLSSSVRWAPFIVMACFALSYLAAQQPTGDDPEDALSTMRVVALLLALGCCAALDDPAAAMLAASPTRLAHRRACQALITLVPAALLWLVAYIITVPRTASAATTGLALEAAALTAIAYTAALVAQHSGIHEPSPIAASATVAASMVLLALPHSISPVTVLTDPAWAAAHQHWTAVLASLALIASWAVRDPASRPFHRYARRRQPHEQHRSCPNDLI